MTTCGKKIKVFSGNFPKSRTLDGRKQKVFRGGHGGCLLSYQSTNSRITNLLLFSDTSALQCKIVFSLIRILQKALRRLAFVCTAWEFSFKVFTLFLKFPIFVSKLVRQSPQTSVLGSHFSYIEMMKRNVQRNL